MAEDILHSRRPELSSNNLDFNKNIFDEALCELNKEVESLSGISIKDFRFTLPLNLNLNATINAEYIRETNYIFTSWKVCCELRWWSGWVLHAR